MNVSYIGVTSRSYIFYPFQSKMKMGFRVLQDIPLHCYSQSNVVYYGVDIKASVGVASDCDLTFVDNRKTETI